MRASSRRLHVDDFAVSVVPDTRSVILVHLATRAEFGYQQSGKADNHRQSDYGQADRRHDENHQGGNSQSDNRNDELADNLHVNPRFGFSTLSIGPNVHQS